MMCMFLVKTYEEGCKECVDRLGED